MTVEQLASALSCEVLALPEPTRSVHGAYVGDLLSWVMGRAQPDQAWVTIMTNANTVAVATLSDVSLILLAENSEMSPETVALAKEKGVNVLRSPSSAYELCVAMGRLFS